MDRHLVVDRPGSSIRNPEILKGLAFVAATGVLLGVAPPLRQSGAALGQPFRGTDRVDRRPHVQVPPAAPTQGSTTSRTSSRGWAGSVDEFDDHLELFACHVHPDDRARFSATVGARADHAGPVLIRWVAPDGRVCSTR
ncbi:MAG: hypothetical protein R2697_19680 [Ilumatobacteraceae bacterium]